jgi:hypothetical protein
MFFSQMFKNPKPQTHHRLLSLLSQSIALATAWEHFKVKQALRGEVVHGKSGGVTLLWRK